MNGIIILKFKHGIIPCTDIKVNYQTKEISIKNYTNQIMDRAFGVIENPTWEDYIDFLKDRCPPKDALIMKKLNLTDADPLDIVKITQGWQPYDKFWLDISSDRGDASNVYLAKIISKLVKHFKDKDLLKI